MSKPVVYIALQEFGQLNDRPLQLLLDADCDLRRNSLGRRLRGEELPELLRDAVVVVAGLEPYDETVLAQLPNLRCISRCGVGTDSIDLVAAERHRIRVYTTPEEVAEPVAQLTLAMIFALARNLPFHLHDAQQGLWKRRTGVLLAEWTIGLVGFGRIGRLVERYLRPFGSRVLICDPFVALDEIPESVTSCSLESLLHQADLVSLHASCPRDDAPLLGRRQLAMMKPGGYLVNTARGYLVDQEALYEHLVAGHLAGAALDVFQEEPCTGILTQLPQILCTPHVGSLTRASRIAMETRCAKHAVEFLTHTGRLSLLKTSTVGDVIAASGRQARQRGIGGPREHHRRMGR